MKYVKAFEVANLVLEDRRCVVGGRPREHYRDDVIRTAALAAAETSTIEAAVDAIERAFQAARIDVNPRWDGSIA